MGIREETPKKGCPGWGAPFWSSSPPGLLINRKSAAEGCGKRGHKAVHRPRGRGRRCCGFSSGPARAPLGGLIFGSGALTGGVLAAVLGFLGAI